MVLRELFAVLGLQIDEASFVKGQLVADGIKLALGYAVEKAQELGTEFVAAMKDVVAAGASVSAAAAAADVTTDEYQRLEGAAAAAGVSFDSLRAAAVKLKGSSGSVRQGLADFADELAALPPGADRTTAAIDRLGESGRELVPMFEQGAASVGRLLDQAATLNDEQLAAAADLARAQKALTSLTQQFWRAAIGPLLPVLRDVVNAFVAWKRENEAISRQRIHSVMEGVASALSAIWRFAQRAYESLSQIARLVYDRLAKGFRYLYEKASQALGFILTKWVQIKGFVMDHGIQIALAALAVAFQLVGVSGVTSAVKTGIAWALTAAKFLAIAGVLTALYLAFDDVAAYEESVRRGGTGKNTMYGRWKNEIDGMVGKVKDFIANLMKPNADDPWWLKAIKKFADYLDKSYGILAKLHLAQPGGPTVEADANSWKAKALRMAGVTDPAWVGRLPGMNLTRDEELPAYARPTSGPMSIAPAGHTASILNQQSNQIVINPAPGASPEAIAQAVDERLQSHWNAQMEAANASVPGG